MRIPGADIVLRDESCSTDDEDFLRWLNLEDWNYYDEPDKPFEVTTREQYNKRLEERRHGAPSTTSHTWQVDTAAGRHIGWVNYYHLDSQAKRAYVGICLPEQDTWSQGYGTEALRLLVEHLFTSMHLEEVRTATWSGNKRMMRCAEKSGFAEAARMPHRADQSVRGEPLERVEFSVSRIERARRADG